MQGENGIRGRERASAIIFRALVALKKICCLHLLDHVQRQIEAEEVQTKVYTISLCAGNVES